MKNKVRAFLFDMDGLLMDTEIVHTHAYMELSARYGKPQPAEKLFDFIGHTAPITTKWLVETVGIDADPDALIEEELDIYYRLLDERRPPAMPGVREMFALGEQHGLNRALVSSSIRVQVEPTMKLVCGHIGKSGEWRSHFHTVCTGDRVVNRKPAPDLYQLALKELGLASKDCIAFEDSPAGVTAAHAAGIPVVAVPNTYLKGRDVAQGKAQWVFESLADAHHEMRKLFE
jgi:beta-phosphoglucomutase-like phosphatase (HAD superfamily)